MRVSLAKAAAVAVIFGWFTFFYYESHLTADCVHSCVNITCYQDAYGLCYAWSVPQGDCMWNTTAGNSHNFTDLRPQINWYSESTCSDDCPNSDYPASATSCKDYSSTDAVQASKQQCNTKSGGPC